MEIEEHHQKGLALWAADCAERALQVFEQARPEDRRPRKALDSARSWARGDIPMSVARGASSAANAAARETEEGSPARDAARAAGHAAASAHNPSHALYAASYAVKAIVDNAGGDDQVGETERNWQSEHLPEDLRWIVYPPETA